MLQRDCLCWNRVFGFQVVNTLRTTIGYYVYQVGSLIWFHFNQMCFLSSFLEPGKTIRRNKLLILTLSNSPFQPLSTVCFRKKIVIITNSFFLFSTAIY